GDAMRLHVLAPYSEQSHLFSIEGHEWPMEPGRPGSTLQSAAQVGGMDALTFEVPSAGGREMLPGDYLYGDHREPFREAGLWGLLRVYAPGSATVNLRALN